MTEDKHPSDQLLDLLVYAPLGFLGEARSLFPSLAELGRQRVNNARVLGQFVVKMGQSEAERRLAQLEGRARRSLGDLGLVPPDPERGPVAANGSGPAPVPPVAAEPVVAVADAPDVASLAIPDYDSLAASQVVSRLAGLRPDELDAVHRYELATRGRKTILGKIAQIQSA